MKYMSLTFVALALAVASSGQQRGSLSDHNLRGNAKVIVTPAASPANIDDLVRMSRTIVCGTVTSDSSNRVFGRGLARRPMVITEVRVAVDRVIKGEVRGKAGHLLLSQVGGRSEDGDVEAVNDTLLSEGESYVLFLLDDEGQSDRPNVSNLPRYSVVGVWSGKVRIADQRIKFLPSVHPELRKLNGMSLDEFLVAVQAASGTPPVSTERLPIHPGGDRRK